MPGGSPSVDRMISILNFFISHPQESFSLAQVVKSLKLNRATCYAIMTSLADAGYLYRNSDKTYVLGPAILAIARQAQAAFSPLDVARLEMRQLADKLDVVVSVQVLQDGMVVSRERATSVTHLTLSYPEDMRHALHPWGILFLSGLEDHALETEFAKATPPLSADQRAFERELIGFSRRHGFLFAINVAEETVRQRIKTEGWATGEFLTSLDPDATYPLQFIAAPIFAHDDEVAFELAVSGFRGDYTGRRISEIGEVVAEACQRVTSFITG